MHTFAGFLDDVVRLDESLAKMEAAGAVSKEIDPILDRTISFVTWRERSWFQGEPTPKIFTMYHTWRNLRLIFTKMRTRFANSELVHDNPLVVDQAREIVPRILSILAALVSTEQQPTDAKTEQILHHVRKLRASARLVGMIEPKDELREVDQTKLVAALDKLLAPMAAPDEA